jgi:hypothetical protein
LESTAVPSVSSVELSSVDRDLLLRERRIFRSSLTALSVGGVRFSSILGPML